MSDQEGTDDDIDEQDQVLTATDDRGLQALATTDPLVIEVSTEPKKVERATIEQAIDEVKAEKEGIGINNHQGSDSNLPCPLYYYVIPITIGIFFHKKNCSGETHYRRGVL